MHHDDVTRRQLFGWLGKTAAAVTLAGCFSETDKAGPDASGATCATIPEETQGPYPGDGTNGANALALSGIVRSDIRPSLSSSLVATGVAMTLSMTLLDSATCAPLAGYAVYIWHCDQDGDYSMYSSAVADESYLRGVQITDATGQVEFTTVFPACYAGRWPHIHIEVYASAAAATNGKNAVATTQLAMPKAVCDAVYATDGYSQSVANLAQVSLASDMVFSDGASLELPTVTGSASAGYNAAIQIAIAA